MICSKKGNYWSKAFLKGRKQTTVYCSPSCCSSHSFKRGGINRAPTKCDNKLRWIYLFKFLGQIFVKVSTHLCSSHIVKHCPKIDGYSWQQKKKGEDVKKDLIIGMRIQRMRKEACPRLSSSVYLGWRNIARVVNAVQCHSLLEARNGTLSHVTLYWRDTMNVVSRGHSFRVFFILQISLALSLSLCWSGNVSSSLWTNVGELVWRLAWR